VIYKDKKAPNDLVSCPAERREPCLNCKRTWAWHAGWCCPGVATLRVRFDLLEASERYLTASMAASLIDVTLTPPETKPVETVADWRAWAHNCPGDCACGIRRVDCTYHKDQL
jgi:hypothetical protein